MCDVSNDQTRYRRMAGDAKTVELDRRALIVGASALAVLPIAPGPAWAADDELAKAVRGLTAGAAVTPGRVTLTMPELAENGNAVALTVAVESPMTAADHVKAIHIFGPANPMVTLARFHLNPRSGRAKVSTTVRLADSQKVLAVAQLSDGSFWSGDAFVLVTLAACIDAG
jgi:sulfur-oxidizing protein SoxY